MNGEQAVSIVQLSHFLQSCEAGRLEANRFLKSKLLRTRTAPPTVKPSYRFEQELEETVDVIEGVVGAELV